MTIATEQIKNPLTVSELSKKGLCDYVVNVATGCLHGCTFCYVPSTPVVRMRAEHIKASGVNDPQMDWGKYLLIREDLPQQLEKALLSSAKWVHTDPGKGVVMLCSGTDPYQNSQTAKITRQAVQLLLKHGKRVRILTRSPLWVKDLDILVNPNVTVGMSIPFLDDEVGCRIEPNAPLISDRLKAMEKGRKTGCRLYFAMAPTPPFVKEFEFDRILCKFRQFSPEVIFWEPINARGTNGKRMLAAGFDWVSRITNIKDAAANFLLQHEALLKTAYKHRMEELIHVWPDSEIVKHIEKTDDRADLAKWFYKPTSESWYL